MRGQMKRRVKLGNSIRFKDRVYPCPWGGKLVARYIIHNGVLYLVTLLHYRCIAYYERRNTTPQSLRTLLQKSTDSFISVSLCLPGPKADRSLGQIIRVLSPQTVAYPLFMASRALPGDEGEPRIASTLFWPAHRPGQSIEPR